MMSMNHRTMAQVLFTSKALRLSCRFLLLLERREHCSVASALMIVRV